MYVYKKVLNNDCIILLTNKSFFLFFVWSRSLPLGVFLKLDFVFAGFLSAVSESVQLHSAGRVFGAHWLASPFGIQLGVHSHAGPNQRGEVTIVKSHCLRWIQNQFDYKIYLSFNFLSFAQECLSLNSYDETLTVARLLLIRLAIWLTPKTCYMLTREDLL